MKLILSDLQGQQKTDADLIIFFSRLNPIFPGDRSGLAYASHLYLKLPQPHNCFLSSRFPILYQPVDQADFSFGCLKPPAGFFLSNFSLSSPWNAVPTTMSCIYKTAVYNSLLCKEKSNLQPKQLTIPIPLLSQLCYKKVILFNGGGGPIEKNRTYILKGLLD